MCRALVMMNVAAAWGPGGRRIWLAGGVLRAWKLLDNLSPLLIEESLQR